MIIENLVCILNAASVKQPPIEFAYMGNPAQGLNHSLTIEWVVLEEIENITLYKGKLKLVCMQTN